MNTCHNLCHITPLYMQVWSVYCWTMSVTTAREEMESRQIWWKKLASCYKELQEEIKRSTWWKLCLILTNTFNNYLFPVKISGSSKGVWDIRWFARRWKCSQCSGWTVDRGLYVNCMAWKKCDDRVALGRCSQTMRSCVGKLVSQNSALSFMLPPLVTVTRSCSLLWKSLWRWTGPSCM